MRKGDLVGIALFCVTLENGTTGTTGAGASLPKPEVSNELALLAEKPVVTSEFVTVVVDSKNTPVVTNVLVDVSDSPLVTRELEITRAVSQPPCRWWGCR